MIDTKKPVHINSMNFDRFIENRNILVDFWAGWCSPCRAMEPVLDDFAKTKGDQIMVGKVNVDENPSLAQRFGIRSIPTMILFKNGKESKRIVGLQTLPSLLNQTQ